MCMGLTPFGFFAMTAVVSVYISIMDANMKKSRISLLLLGACYYKAIRHFICFKWWSAHVLTNDLIECNKLIVPEALVKLSALRLQTSTDNIQVPYTIATKMQCVHSFKLYKIYTYLDYTVRFNQK